MATGGWFCCCESGCFPFSDGFDRANSTDLGPDWNELSGDWWIDNSQLIAKSSGLILATIPAVSATIYYAQVKTISEQPGQTWTIVLNASSDGLVYYYAKFTRSSATVCSLSVGLHDLTGDHPIDSWSTNSFSGNTFPLPNCPADPPQDLIPSRLISVCLSADGIFATCPSPTQEPGAGPYEVWGDATISSARTKLGLASAGGTSAIPVKFDDYASEWRTGGTAECGSCGCKYCNGGYTTNAHALTATITGAFGCCANKNGTTFSMGRLWSCVWIGRSPTTPNCLVLTAGDPWKLTIYVGGGPPDTCWPDTNGSGACKPMNMVFPIARYNYDPYTCLQSPPQCGGEVLACLCTDNSDPGYPCRTGGFDITITE